MPRLLRPLIVALTALPAIAVAALDRPWQTITNPTAAEAAALFASPPPEYSAQFTWGWAGPVDPAVIARDLDAMQALGVHAAIIEPKAGMKDPYLSPGYFNLVRTAVAAAKQRGMRLWIMDDGDYPSGLAGGKFTLERPDLRMQALAAPERIAVAAGARLARPLGADVICATAVNRTTHATRLLDPPGGQLDFTAPAGSGDWEILLARWQFRSGPTRSANNPTGAKDFTHSLMDFLSPAATQQFEHWTFDPYLDVIGDELGHTVLGFRGDEPAYNFNPWTPALLAEFQQRKGYDLRPYLAAFPLLPADREPAAGSTSAGSAPPPMTDEQRRAYADYCDVWSDLFRDQYFDREATWCAAHGVELQCHIEHEEILLQLARADGDYFKCFRHVQIPGVDIIWHQLWMDNPADFPKLASSAAHLYGRPRAMCEAFAAYRPAPDLAQARWCLDFLLSRGINRIEYMFWPASVPPAGPKPSVASASLVGATASATPPRPPSGFNKYYRDPGFPAVAAYVNRLSYLLGAGRPAAQIGLYLPSSSFWLADAAASETINQSLLALAHALLAAQRDFDFVDEQALSSDAVLRLDHDTLVNLSGQPYRAIIVPSCAAISRAALERLHAFAAAGGRVIFVGPAPALVVDRTFLHAAGPADISWATFHEPSTALTAAVLAALPPPDLAPAAPAPLVSYQHRRLHDADVYFIFNSDDKSTADLRLTLAGTGAAQRWDAATGHRSTLPTAAAAGGRIGVSLSLAPAATTVVVIGGAAPPVARD